MQHEIMEVAVPDPGQGSRLGPDARKHLGAGLASAVKGKAACVLLRVEGSAWDQGQTVDAQSWPQPVATEVAQLVRAMFSAGPPVVVALDGPVSGLGTALALAADVRICSPGTTFGLGTPDTAGSLLGGATWLLEHAVGRAVLQHLAWTGSTLDADRALATAVVSEVAADPVASARATAERLAQVPTQAATALKRALTSRHRADLDATLDYEAWLPGIALTTGTAP